MSAPPISPLYSPSNLYILIKCFRKQAITMNRLFNCIEEQFMFELKSKTSKFN